MATRERPADRGRRRAGEDLTSIGRDVRRHRTGSGLSLRDVDAASGVDHVQIWEFEHGRRSGLALDDIAAIGAVVGLDVRLRAFPGGDAIRDAGQARLLDRLRTRLHPGLHWATEVPLPIRGDLRAWDAVIAGASWRLPVDAETVLADVQATERRLTLKTRDTAADIVVLLVADTRRNRHALASAPSAFRELPGRTRDVLGALGRGEPPRASGIVLL